MYLRQYTKLPFFDGFDLFRKLKMLDPKQHDPLIYIQRPPEANLGYPLQDEVKDTENQKVLNKLLHRYPDLKYAPFVKEGAGENQNQPVILRFLQLFNKLRSKGLQFDKAFDKAEMQFQGAMQRKIDQTNIANNLAITNQARSFMTLAQQEIEYESRLKRDRLLRDMKIQEFEQKSPLDPQTEALMQNYRKALIKVASHEDVPEETDHKQDEEIFEKRAQNVFNCYYRRVAAQDKMNGLSDKQILERIRATPTKIKHKLQKFLQLFDASGCMINDDLELIIPDTIPEDDKLRLQKGIYYVAALYRDIDYEFKHHGHLKHYTQELNDLKQKKRNHESSRKVDEVAEQAINKVLQQDEIKTTATFKLFETDKERLARLQIKWLHRRIEEVEILKLQSEAQTPEEQQKIQERLDNLQKQATDMVDNLRKLKVKLEYESVAKAGEQLFEEHSILLEDINEFTKANQIHYEDVAHYFKLSFEQRRLTQAAQVNDDIIHNLIKVQNLKAHVSRLNHDDLENKVYEGQFVDDNTAILKQKLLDQFKLFRQAKKAQLKGTEEEFLEDDGGEEELYSELLMDGPEDNLQALEKKQKEVREQLAKEKAAEEKRKEDELKSLQGIKGQKGSKKKKPAK